MIELLAVLSASAAAGLRIALPLLVIGVLRNDLWSSVPFLSQFSPQVVVGVLVSWSLFEIFASKKILGQRIIQIIQLLFSPFVGAILGLAIAKVTNVQQGLYWIIAIVAGLLALVLQLVQTGLFYRLRGLPLWVILAQDILCVFLVIFAFDAPKQGGLIALLLLWLSIRISGEWYRWYRKQSHPGERNPRRYKREPD